jgi:hypothetical protein
MLRIVLSLLLLLSAGSLDTINSQESQGESKIRFDLSPISESGLIGVGTGKRSFAYEFCIPANPRAVREVFSIDPSLKIYPRSSGRVGCKPGEEYLCMGETHQVGWREILFKLADLPYIKVIEPYYGE